MEYLVSDGLQSYAFFFIGAAWLHIKNVAAASVTGSPRCSLQHNVREKDTLQCLLDDVARYLRWGCKFAYN